jgi:hypothetical protein
MNTLRGKSTGWNRGLLLGGAASWAVIPLLWIVTVVLLQGIVRPDEETLGVAVTLMLVMYFSLFPFGLGCLFFLAAGVVRLRRKTTQKHERHGEGVNV